MTPRSLVPFIALVFFSSALLASNDEKQRKEELIAKVTQAYGGKALTELKSYRIVDHYLTPTTGQSHTPSLMEVSSTKQVLHVDMANNRAAYDSLSEGRSGAYQRATISDGEKAYNINHQAQTYGEARSADPHVFAGGTMRTSDTVLAYELGLVADKATLNDDTHYMNRPHHVITMPFPSSPDLILYIDSNTFLISKMVRKNPSLGDLSYVFSGHKAIDGISSSTSTSFFIDGQPNLISTKHTITFNQSLSESDVTLASNLSAEGERIDDSEMVTTKLGDGLYHIGQNGGFSLFADTPTGIVAAGGYGGLSNRFAHFQNQSNNFKALSHQIVTHHHSDHIGGLGEAVSLGAKLVTVNDNINTIKDSITPTPSDTVFHNSGKRTTLGDGRKRIDIYEVSTSHAASFLVMYSPANKTVFIADHYGSPFAKGLPTASQSSVDMYKELKKLDIDIKKIATAHNARIFTMNELKESVAAFKPIVCNGKRPVCT